MLLRDLRRAISQYNQESTKGDSKSVKLLKAFIGYSSVVAGKSADDHVYWDEFQSYAESVLSYYQADSAGSKKADYLGRCAYPEELLDLFEGSKNFSTLIPDSYLKKRYTSARARLLNQFNDEGQRPEQREAVAAAVAAPVSSAAETGTRIPVVFSAPRKIDESYFKAAEEAKVAPSPADSELSTGEELVNLEEVKKAVVNRLRGYTSFWKMPVFGHKHNGRAYRVIARVEGKGDLAGVHAALLQQSEILRGKHCDADYDPDDAYTHVLQVVNVDHAPNEGSFLDRVDKCIAEVTLPALKINTGVTPTRLSAIPAPSPKRT